MNVSVGRIVRYVRWNPFVQADQELAAIVCDVIDADSQLVSLTAFLPTGATEAVIGVPYNAEKARDSWHWPAIENR